MSKHTPGPWKIVNDKYGGIEIIADVRDYIYTVVPANEYLIVENARLIAAAPELLEALQKLVAWDLESLPGEVSLGYSGIEQDIARAKAAIVKATGET